ncbi:MAG TPA: branched-chain amino acid ABC transporter permease [Trueperaceae bacterium]|jgi:branched-chain amino acid transport system permease protein|nr:branched-chain amino acid ABC transporter permease [Trueperaceae bacterium]
MIVALEVAANTLTQGSVYVLTAIGLTMVYGLLGILHVAHAAVYTFGAWMGFLTWRATGSFWLALLAGGAASGAAGVGIFEGVYRRIADRPKLVPLIASVGILIVASAVFERPFAIGTRRLPFRPDTGLPALETDLVYVGPTGVALILVAALVVAGLLVVFRRTRLGLDWRALSMDAEMAEAIGIPARLSMNLAFFLGSFLAGLGGVLVSGYEGRVFAAMGDVVSYKAFIVVVLGGLGNVPGAIVAAYLLAFIESFAITVFGYVLPRDAIGFTLLILVLMFRPQGLFARGA